jgi:hypothetical protein
VRKSTENHGARLLEDLDDLVVRARRILRKAEEDGHSKTALAAIKETRASIMSIAQISHAIWEAQQQTTIEVQAREEDKWHREGFRKLTKEKQRQYADLVYEMFALGNDRFDPEDFEDPEPESPADELYLDQEDFSLKPRQVPVRRKDPVKKDLQRTRIPDKKSVGPTRRMPEA